MKFTCILNLRHAACVKKIIFKDNQNLLSFKLQLSFFGMDQSYFIEKNNLIFIKKDVK